jgi:predicted PurR-regulated permease PerM
MAMRLHRLMFGLFAAVVSVAFLWVIAPYSGAILWSIIFAILFTARTERLAARLGGRNNVASLLMVILIILLIILPAVLLASLVLAEAVQVYQNATSGGGDLNGFVDALLKIVPPWAEPFMQRLGLGTRPEALATISSALSGALSSIASSALNIGKSALSLALGFAVALYLTFFLLRDGRQVVETIARTVPLDRAVFDALARQFASVIRATIKGSLVVALAQGLAGGIIVALLGIPAAPLWGTLMAAMSLIPALGAPIVWIPLVFYLLVTGAIGKAVILTACGVLVIGTLDNILRPILVGRETRMPDALVLLSTLGGIAVAGFNGLIVGPVIAALFLTIWTLVRRSGPASAAAE